MKLTKTEMLAKGILSSGYEELPGRSSKYRTFYNEHAPVRLYLFLGKSGGLRWNRCAGSSDSLSLEGSQFRLSLLRVGALP